MKVPLIPESKDSFYSHEQVNTSAKSQSFHVHEKLPFSFVEENNSAKRAARRAQRAIAKKKRDAQRLAEHERKQRWYNKESNITRRPYRKQGVELAASRIQAHRREQVQAELRKQKQRSQRWYTNRGKQDTTVVEMMQQNAERILQEIHRRDATATKLEQAVKLRKRDHIDKVMKQATLAFNKCQPKEPLLSGKCPFYPGPYLNRYEITYSHSGAATPTRTFRATAHGVRL